MFLKQVIPLLLLYADGDKYINGRTRFQKMIFLAQKEGQNVKEWYGFFPHDFGPYSVELQEDLNFLKREEFITELPECYGGKIRYQYFLTERGTDLIQKVLSNQNHETSLMPTLNALKAIKEKYRESPLDMLINDVYKKYPEYAVVSKYTTD